MQWISCISTFSQTGPRALTAQFADKPTCGLPSRGLVKSQKSKLVDSKFLSIMEKLHYICTLKLTLILTLSNTNSVIYPK